MPEALVSTKLLSLSIFIHPSIYVHLFLFVCGFCICGFSQPLTKNIHHNKYLCVVSDQYDLNYVGTCIAQYCNTVNITTLRDLGFYGFLVSARKES